jgi:hypothetical protein
MRLSQRDAPLGAARARGASRFVREVALGVWLLGGALVSAGRRR